MVDPKWCDCRRWEDYTTTPGHCLPCHSLARAFQRSNSTGRLLHPDISPQAPGRSVTRPARRITDPAGAREPLSLEN